VSLFAAIRAPFLPGKAELAAEGDTAGFHRRLDLVSGAVTAAGLEVL